MKNHFIDRRSGFELQFILSDVFLTYYLPTAVHCAQEELSSAQ